MKVPDKGEFPGTGPTGNGISAGISSQAEWLRTIKSGGCLACHALGTRATRELSPALGHFESSVAAWQRRVQSGQAGTDMMRTLNTLGSKRALEMFSDWTDRSGSRRGAARAAAPHGLERNVVITEWDWADPKAYLHDEVSTDRRNPTLNANGLIYGSLELSADYLPVLNPATNSISQVKLTVRDPNTPVAQGPMMLQPSPFWGTEAPWVSRNNVHNPMFDERGRVWITSTVRPPENPDFCKAGSTLPSAKAFPLERSGRQLAMYDPASGKLTHISTCFSTHHLMFAEDANRTLWTSGGGQVVGWLNTKMFDETGDEQKSQGWTALIMDTNGNGKRDAYVEPGDPVDPTKDKRFGGAFYAVSPTADGSIWGSVLGFPGRDRQAHAGVESAGDGARRGLRATPRQSEGSGAWLFAARHGCRSQRRRVGRAGQRPSGQLRSAEVQGTAERTERNGPALPRGWTLYPEPLPQMKGVSDSGARNRATTPGSISSTPLDSAPTRRSTPATNPKVCWC